MSDVPENYVKLKNELRPHWEALVRAVHDKGLYITGFIYGETDTMDEDGPFLVRFGNVWTDSPDEMFYIHYKLAQMAMNLETIGQVSREITHLEPSDERKSSDGPKVPTPQELADTLVLSLMAVPSTDLPDQVQDLLKRYAESRKPKGK